MPSKIHLLGIRPERSRARTSHHDAARRRGVAVLEFVLCLPILILPLLAILRYGMYYANLQQVALACRMGAEEASQTTGLDTASTIPSSSPSLKGNT